MNLLVPEGGVFIKIAGFPLTEGALINGLNRALTLTGLFYMSRCVLTGILLPQQNFGLFLSRLAFYVNFFEENRKTVKLKTFFFDIDTLLVKASTGRGGRMRVATSTTAGPGRYFIYYAVLSLHCFFLIIQW